MAQRAFSPLRFFRQSPAGLLQRFFESKAVFAEFQGLWADPLEPQPETLAAAVANSDEPTRIAIERDLRRIHAMSCRGGVAAMLDQASAHEQDWSDDFAALPSHQARALWAYLEAPEVFDLAIDCSLMDRVGRWHQRAVPQGVQARTDEAALDELLQAIRGVYRREGRGRHCHVDCYSRRDPERYCFHAFPEDYAEADLVFDDRGRLASSTRRPASEVIFVHRPTEGLLELHARGGEGLRRQLFDAFARTVLDLGGLGRSDGLPRLDLTPLKDPEFPFRMEPDDAFARADVVDLKLSSPHRRTRQMRFTAHAGDGDDVRRWAVEMLGSGRRPCGDFEVVGARLRFHPRPGGRRPRTLTCELAAPTRCSLRDDPVEINARRCLQRWGICGG